MPNPTLMPEHCRWPGCGRRLVLQREWDRLSLDERATRTAAGEQDHRGRGLCARCWDRAQRTRTLTDYPRLITDGQAVAEDWDFLREQDPALPLSQALTEYAPRLGLSRSSLYKCLVRHGRITPTPRKAAA